jgi:hypothetical protein
MEGGDSDVDQFGVDPLYVHLGCLHLRRPSVSVARVLPCADIPARMFPAAPPGTPAQNEDQGPPGLLSGPPGLI